MTKVKKYWKGIEELENSPEFRKSVENEFPEELPVDKFLGKETLGDTSTNRRDFLKFLGFGVTAATIAACETPVNKAIPYLNKPEEITPGIANWYASTFADGNDYASILVKTREGRPIKIEGNKLSPVTKGAVNARINSSVLSLYDSARLKNPLDKKAAATWAAVDKDIKSQLEAIVAKSGKIRILSNSIISPTTKKAIADFTAKYPGTEQVTYDAVSYSGILKANQANFGSAIIPDYHFEKAEVIVSFGADFLVNWLAAVEYAGQYGQTRNPKNGKMSRHFQFETTLSVTGSNADVRVAIKPSEQGLAVLALYNIIAKAKGAATYEAGIAEEYKEKLQEAATELLASKGSLVVCGSNDTNVQVVVNAINELLGNYGNTIDTATPVYLKQGDDAKVEALVAEMASGSVDAVILYGVNPAYTYGEKFVSALGKVKLKISFADREDETASLVDYVCPDNHYLESWNDANPKKGQYSLGQPSISPLFDTRQAQESLLTWAGIETSYHDYLKANWQTTVGASWESSLHDGFYSVPVAQVAAEPAKPFAVAATTETPAAPATDISSAAAALRKGVTAGATELQIYIKTGLGDGSQANNPWLQELPDPISKVTWDNYVTMSPKQMAELGLSRLERGDDNADVVEVTVNGVSIKAPAFPQPGQKYGTVGLALGYGRTAAGKTADGIGANAYQFVSVVDGNATYAAYDVTVKGTGEKYEIAATQTHHTLMGREAIVKETTLTEYLKDPKSGNPELKLQTTNHGKQPVKNINLWRDHDLKLGHLWGLSIDLNSCIGCGSCVTSCTSENNVAVVGKDEVRRSREMHWMRIDRYYSSDMNQEVADAEGLNAIDKFTEMEAASENPQVSFQPLMCQHCNHAPCETVCPVAATTHSLEGLNMMAYNRCIGTRYCANNCPYKVRRFNWFKYFDNEQFDFNMNDDLGKMVLNPDVVVRSRGVMEKCSLCVQQIQAGKLTAKKEGRKVKDGEIQTACASACPTNAITFGDLNDETTLVSKLSKDDRSYNLLEEVGVQPNVYYQTKVRNVKESA